MRRNINAFVHMNDGHYVAECLGVSIVTQGRTLDETIANLREAAALYLDGEDPAEHGLVSDPGLLVTLDLGPVADFR